MMTTQRRVNAFRRSHFHPDIGHIINKRPDWCGDFCGLEDRGRNLKKERLEEMMIIAIDKRHLGIAVAQLAHDGHAGKSGTDHHYFAPRRHAARPSTAEASSALRSALARRLRECGVSRSLDDNGIDRVNDATIERCVR
jgi:hypothetical protein